MNACTLWFDHIGPWSWEACCAAHDAAYAALIPKALADTALGACVNAVLPGMGTIMWAGVTLFGGFWYLAAAARYFNRRA